MPKYGQKIQIKPLCFSDLQATQNLIDLFDRIEDILHSSAIDLEQRFSVILQILLAKLFDEHGHISNPSIQLEIQDFDYLGYDGQLAIESFNAVLKKAVNFYQKYLPKPVETKLPSKINGNILLEICKLISPVLLIASKRDVIQSFYMKFAKGLYKWDLAQYFTPPPVTDFIVDIINPRFGEHMKDPACGSADFLTSAFHKMRNVDVSYAHCIWGADNSKNAVQVAVLNMLLNGDGKSNIKEEDSLASVDSELDRYEIMICNPPFGVKIVEKDVKILRKFDLGHSWRLDEKNNTFIKENTLVKSRETGILFTELCVKQAKQDGGRVGIILPNGYLSNRSAKYKQFREWLLRHTKIAAVCSFPRFTFKTSGADVSASVLYLERREKPLTNPAEDSSYHVAIEMIETVGWNLGDKKAAPCYLRDIEDGSFIIGDDGARILDADFAKSLFNIRNSLAVQDFPWLAQDHGYLASEPQGWAIPISSILEDPDYTLDPKRNCKKVTELRSQISSLDHFVLGDLVDFIPQLYSVDGKKIKKDNTAFYNYVEIQDIGFGDLKFSELRGWQLPDRAKHFAASGDLFIGSIWGSVSKWCIIPQNLKDIVVTNGCHRLRIKTGKEQYLTDVIAFLCSEAFSVQMRSFARGSDGLAEITEEDTKKVLIPKLELWQRKEVQPFLDSLMNGLPDVHSKVADMLRIQSLNYPNVKPRPSHVVLV